MPSVRGRVRRMLVTEGKESTPRSHVLARRTDRLYIEALLCLLVAARWQLARHEVPEL